MKLTSSNKIIHRYLKCDFNQESHSKKVTRKLEKQNILSSGLFTITRNGKKMIELSSQSHSLKSKAINKLHLGGGGMGEAAKHEYCNIPKSWYMYARRISFFRLFQSQYVVQVNIFLKSISILTCLIMNISETAYGPRYLAVFLCLKMTKWNHNWANVWNTQKWKVPYFIRIFTAIFDVGISVETSKVLFTEWIITVCLMFEKKNFPSCTAGSLVFLHGNNLPFKTWWVHHGCASPKM